jgi:hypothetical protein
VSETGLIRGSQAIDNKNVPGWLHLGTGVFSAISVAAISVAESTHWTRVHRDGFVSLVGSEGAAFLVRDMPEGTTTSALPATLGDPASLYVQYAPSAPGLFVKQVADESTWLIDPETGSVRPVPLVPPRGQTLFSECVNPSPSFDSSDHLLVPTRDAGVAMIQRVDLETASWTPLGQAVAGVTQLAAHERGGTYLVSATNQPAFCPEPTWEPSSGETLLGNTLQLIRPSDDLHHVLPVLMLTPAQLSRDGMCFAYPDDDAIMVFDVLSGRRTRLALEGWFQWL